MIERTTATLERWTQKVRQATGAIYQLASENQRYRIRGCCEGVDTDEKSFLYAIHKVNGERSQ